MNLSKEEINRVVKILSCDNCPTSYACEGCDITQNDKLLIKKYIASLERENTKLKTTLNYGLDKNKKYCFNEDGNTGKCLGYSNINDDESCEYCKSCERLSLKGDD